MWDFEIQLKSVQDVQEFVALATAQSFPVLAGTDRYKVSGKCFMEMFCLDFTRPLYAFVECSEGEYIKFCKAAKQFVVER